jgi:uncharacterized phage protein (TIGR02218 family)
VLQRLDGEVLGFTDHDDLIVLNGVSCEPTSGFTPSEAVSSLGLASDNQDIEGVFSSDQITVVDLEAERYDGARVEVYRVNWADPTQYFHDRTALLGEITRDDDVFRVELRGLTSLLDRPQGRRYSKSCDAELGDMRCGVDLSQTQWGADGEVLEVISNKAIRITRPPQAADFFAQGSLVWEGGANAGEKTPLVSAALRSDDVLHLWSAPPFAMEVGDTFRLLAGCDKRFATCKAKFGNGGNFQGFPHMPTEDFALSYASNQAVHDGAPLVR